MEQHTLRQLRGAVDLVTDMVDGTVRAIGEAHQELAQRPYAVIGCLGPVAAPVQVIEQMQHGITVGVYGTIRAITQMIGTTTTFVLDQMVEKA